MSPRKITTFRIDEEILAELAEIRDRDGVPIPEQVRRGIQMWLDSKREQKAPRKRVSPRKRG